MRTESPERQTELSVLESAPAFRLRYVLAAFLVLGVVGWAYPRGKSAWELHNLAVTYADYGLCMVGPTGPQLLRDKPEVFRELARRKLVASSPEAAPFKKCEPLAEKMPLGHIALRTHSAPAANFAEYHNTPFPKSQTSVQRLELELDALEELARAAWPFVRSGPMALMKPSSHAREASHPSSPAQPGRGSGLPATRHTYRSTAAFGDTVVASLGSGANGQVLLSKNGGVDWVQGGTRLAGEIRDRCMADEEGRAFTLSKMNDGQHIVLSHGPGAAPQVAVLASSKLRIAGISCDQSALVAALVSAPDETGHRPVQLRTCPFRRPCQDMRLPATGSDLLYYPVDVARMDGDTIVSRLAGGITRVASSRDEGRTWTPWTVAYDETISGLGASPFRLLVSADTLFLYSGSNHSASYPLLVSRDHGASFQAPAVDAPGTESKKLAER